MVERQDVEGPVVTEGHDADGCRSAPYQYGDEADYLYTFVQRIRRKIEPNRLEPRYLLRQPGVGYWMPLPEGASAVQSVFTYDSRRTERVRRHERRLDRVDSRLSPRLHAQLVQNRAYMRLHRFVRDAQICGDLLI